MPISATVVGDRGYVWDAEGATWLRRHCRVVGAMSGNSAEHKQHNSAGGLPCELNPEELQLALCQGWVVIRTTASLPEPTANAAAPSTGLSTEHIQPKDLRGATVLIDVIQLSLLYTVLNITLLIQCMHAQSMQCKMTSPSSQSYIVWDGAKFGADYLLYPGDPLLFHAQFTVRILEHDTPIKPALLAGSARGSHAARKHLLLASVSVLTYCAARHHSVFACTCCICISLL
ncbi:TPA: hypothetical protein ACH3X2_005570 [Trebouxia sp. C0005]